MTARALVVQPDAPDGRPWLILEQPVPSPLPGETVWLTESSHVRLCDATNALIGRSPARPSERRP